MVIDIEVPIKEEHIQPLALGMIHYVIGPSSYVMLFFKKYINPVDQKIF